ncbi:MAG: type VII secretion protein EccCa [Corynebacterium sp.]|uniref:type VII secretion protein EccCa n=1 Tax=Corynebacterium sp. TaxID=1720 RepID=UPI0026DCFAC4|nr:type VII secretion protein EccCa [Corynebacterium sp.]MDO4760825.1 type VII secretion protein EccCa [Corynebacterium sp.]
MAERTVDALPENTTSQDDAGPVIVVEPVPYNQREPEPPLPQGTLEPEPVPEAIKPQPLPLVRILVPLVMVIAIAAMVGLMFLSGGELNPMMLVFPLMMLMGVIMMFSPPQGEDTDEVRRTYLRHLSLLREKAAHNQQAQRRHELHYNPDPHTLWSMLGSTRMWERNSDDPDAYSARVGLGPAELCTPIDMIDPGASEDLDPVCAVSMRHVTTTMGIIENMPVVLHIRAFGLLHLSGPCAHDMVRAMIAQLCFFHGPETLHVSCLGTSFHSWAKWLPHTRISTIHSAEYRIAVLDDTLSDDEIEKACENDDFDTIIVLNNRSDYVLNKAEEDGMCIRAGTQSLAVLSDEGSEPLGVADTFSEEHMVRFARGLTKYIRPEHAEGGRNSGLTGLLGVRDLNAESLNSLWRPRGNKRLAVPIGVDERGRPLILDIKESAHGGMGPHGLCVGATGSGKSELLRTLVVALGATHSPDELNLVLVDFKGGATFLGLEKLPHTSAVITNLSEESVLVERMHDAISGEMNRRQEVLRKAGNFANVTEYNKAADATGDHPRMPALFIVVDEFSELLGQHPDFADLFVAVGRLGRSLHIHLLLASQRLEEGRLRGLDSHLSYRIGLRTFSAAESRQVLGVSEAHRLPSKPGAGYMKTNADELQRFQAAYVSGPLMMPAASQKKTLDKPSTSPAPAAVKLWDGWGEETEEGEVPMVADPRGTLVDALVQAAVEVAQQRGQKAHQVWLPPLPKQLSLGSVVQECGFLQASVGIIDRPYHQRQDPFSMDFSGSKGHAVICGGPQTGKTTAVRAIMVSLAATHSTDQVRFYVLDLAGQGLENTHQLPHVAGIAHRGETEKIGRIVDEVTGFIDEPEPRHTFLIVDGWHVLQSEYEDVMDKVGRIAADGLAARVHLVITTSRWTVVRPAIRDLIAQRVELKLGEALDSLIDRRAQQKVPSLPGRGLSPEGETILFAQAANQDIAHVCTISAGQTPVPSLRMLPMHLYLSDVEAHHNQPDTGVLLGIGGPKLAPLAWDFNQSPHLVCLGSQASGKSTVLSTVMEGVCRLGREQARLVVIDPRRHHLGAIEPTMLAAYAASTQQTEATLADVVVTLKSRLPGPDITPEQLKARSWWQGPDLFIVIDDFDVLSDATMAPLLPLLPHARDIGVHIIVARKAGGAVRAFYQPFLSEIKDQSPMVILLDADKEDGPLFGIRPIPQPPGRGTLISRGSSVGLIHIAEAPPTPNI